ncbi:MAG: sigma-70 family RNA polymerase sigma factor [Acidobacteriota bacterium]
MEPDLEAGEHGSPTSAGQVTRLLRRWRDGDETAFEALVPLVYDELKNLARRQLRRNRRDHTLQPTALVHEAYVRLVLRQRPNSTSRSHFFAIAAIVMRRVLIDHARAHFRQRRGGGAIQVELEEDFLPSDPQRSADLLALDEALDRLEKKDPRKARVVQLRYFGGLILDEVAEVLEVGQSTVVRDWRLARAWLIKELGPPG